MRNLLKYLIFCCVLFTGLSSSAQGQNYERQVPFISAYFLRESIIINPETTFFNVVVLKNLGQTTEEVTVDINVPHGWSVVATENRTYLLRPGDSLNIPVRAAPSKGVEGEIGYSVIASINNRRGENLTNAYSFVKIPRKTELTIRPVTRVSLFDQLSGNTEFSFFISNRGNVNELIFFNLESTSSVAIENEKDNLFAFDLMVKARSDTTIILKAKRLNNNQMLNYNLHRIDLKASTQDKEFNTSFWFEDVTNLQRFIIPESDKMLIVELAAQNLLSGNRSYLTGGVRGNTLFPKTRTFSYNFHKFGTDENLLKYSRILLNYSTPSYSMVVGDLMGFQLRNGFGKGAGISYHPGRYKLSMLAGRNSFRPINNFGIMIDEKYTPFNLSSKYSYTQNQFFNSTAQTFHLGYGLNIKKNHRIRSNMIFSDVIYHQVGSKENGYGLMIEYGGKVGKTTIRLREQLGTQALYGNLAGRHEMTARASHLLRHDLHLDLLITDRSTRPVVETTSGTETKRFQENSEAKLIIRKTLDRNFSVYGGPVWHRKSTNSFYLYDGNSAFNSHSLKVNAGARIRDGAGTSFNPAATVGYTRITGFSVPGPQFPTLRYPEDDRNIFNTHISLNLRKNIWGLYLNYFYGPYSINQEITQFYFGTVANSVRLMPYLETYIYKDILKFGSKLTFMHDFSYKTTRFILNNQLDAYLKHDYTISLLNTFSNQVTTDLLTEDKYSYSNNYFEVRLKKEFNWNQPRIKYYDLEIDLFRDLNGNLKRDFNEPGIKDVIISITSIDASRFNEFGVDYEPSGIAVASRLITSTDGVVKYENLARGIYKIELQNIGNDAARYFPEQNEFTVNLTSDKRMQIPFLERNKIFGRVILNRSRLSTLGRIEASNIKVVATDSKGRQVSTLTDGNGYFEMHVPSIDSYVVSVNNIFRDHFNLRQNDFRANLNGFKQFEVNFVFDEIRRQIEFTPNHMEIQTEVRRVGRTNLSGTVRDAATLQPIRAQVEISDSQGNTIRQINTERGTGRYSTSFATGENMMISISANGYWMNSERLILDQFLTIQDVDRDILLEAITIGARFQLNNLWFGPGSFEIPTEALPELDRLINQLKQNPNVKIRIEGHSDPLETLTQNNVSAHRAETIMRYMIQNGFSNIEFAGLKDSRPAAPSDTENNRRRNRRVEIIVIDR
jgi:outer membrane protein OmpA-like peptidoglycan-associated protein